MKCKGYSWKLHCEHPLHAHKRTSKIDVCHSTKHSSSCIIEKEIIDEHRNKSDDRQSIR